MTTMTTGAISVLFVVLVAVSIFASTILIKSLERIGARLNLTEAMLGLVAALAADMPEISSSATALSRHQHDVGIGIVFGSNVFNLAALLGLGAVVARRIRFHRRVIVLEGVIAVWLVVVSTATVSGLLSPTAGLVLALVLLVPYVMYSAERPGSRQRAPLPVALRTWLAQAVSEEESELLPAIHPSRGRSVDVLLGAGALVVVVGANILMEHAATTIGSRFELSNMVVGGIVLAAVTSLPNAVAAVHLGRSGRGAAMLSEAMNSNTINVLAGFFVPAVAIGLARPPHVDVVVVIWYAGLTVFTLAVAFARRGIGRQAGMVIIAAYVAFVASTVSI